MDSSWNCTAKKYGMWKEIRVAGSIHIWTWLSRLFKTFQGYLKKKFKTALKTYVLLSTVSFYLTKKTMAPTTMKCRLLNVHDLFLCIGFSFPGCYLSQQLSQNNILLTTIKFKTFQDFQGPARTLELSVPEISV